MESLPPFPTSDVRPPPSPSPRWRVRLRRLLRDGGLAAVLVLAGFAAYGNSLKVPFVFDDIHAIVENATIRHLWPPWQALSPPLEHGAGTTGRPLVNLSLAVNYALGGLDVRGYHLTNLLLHLLATLTLWGVLRRTLRLPVLPPRSAAGAESFSWCTALLWSVHPLLTESVVWVVQRNEVMAGLFYLLTLYCFIRSTTAARTVRLWQALAVASCLLGMASKEVVATAPVLVLLYDRTFVAGTFGEAWRRRKWLHVALAAPWLLLAWLVAHAQQRSGTVGFGLGVSSWEYLLTQCRGLLIYLKLAFWPQPLLFDYGDATVKTLAAVWPQALALSALAAATGVALWRRSAWGFVGTWFFVILAPSSSVLPLTTQTLAEHRMYLALAAVIVLAVAGLHRLAGWRPAVASLALAAGLGAVTASRNSDYRSDLAIWSDVAAKLPDNARAHGNLGDIYSRLGRHAEAMAQYEEVLRLQPRYAVDAHIHLGNLLLAAGRTDEAIAHLEQACRQRPDGDAHSYLAVALEKAGRLDEAMSHFAQAARLMADPSRAELYIAAAFTRTDRFQEALPHFEKAVRLKPDDAEAEFNWALTLTRLDRFADADPHFEKAIALEPASVISRNSYGLALASAGRLDEAERQFATALRIDPQNAAAHKYLALVRRRLGRREEAGPHEREAAPPDANPAPGK
jgi:protein O-mannosyl-transferase